MRLVTRPDLDGLTCAVLLSHCSAIDSVALVRPQDVTDRQVSIGPDDVLANLPYHPSCGMWFDNHLLTDMAHIDEGFIQSMQDLVVGTAWAEDRRTTVVQETIHVRSPP